MGYSHDEKEHLSEIKAIAANVFDHKAIKKELSRQHVQVGKALKVLNKAFVGDKELMRDAATNILTDMQQLRSIKAAELIYYSYAIMGSQLVSDSGLNTELRKQLMKILADQVVTSLERIEYAINETRGALKDSDTGSVFIMVNEQVQHCLKDTKDFVNRMTQDNWNSGDEIDTATANFKQATDHLAHVVMPLTDKVKTGVNEAKKAAQQVLAA